MHRLDMLLTLTASLLLPGCGDKDKAPGSGGPTTPAAAHEDHTAPHGGEILELGEEEGHIELVHDAENGRATLYVFGKDLKSPQAVERPVVNLSTKDGPVEVTFTAVDARPDGTATTWKAEHAGFKAEPLDGSLKIKIGAKSFNSPLEPVGHEKK